MAAKLSLPLCLSHIHTYAHACARAHLAVSLERRAENPWPFLPTAYSLATVPFPLHFCPVFWESWKKIQEATDMAGTRFGQMQGDGCFWNVIQSFELTLSELKALEVSKHTGKNGRADLQDSEEKERLCEGSSGDSLCLGFTFFTFLKLVWLIWFTPFFFLSLRHFWCGPFLQSLLTLWQYCFCSMFGFLAVRHVGS